MEINLLGHCLVCLDKIADDKFISSSLSDETVSRMTFVNKVLPQLLLDKSSEKANCIRDLFNHLHFCGPGGDEGKGEDEEAPSSPPPICLSCVEQLSDLRRILEKLELTTEELTSRISEGDGGAFESLMRGSEMVEEETKETTLRFLACLREECCDSNAPTSPERIAEEDDDNDQVEGSNGGPEEDEEYQLLIVKNEEVTDEEDVVEVLGPRPSYKHVPDISNADEVDGVEEAMMEEDEDYKKIFEVGLPDDLIVNKVVMEGLPSDSRNLRKLNAGTGADVNGVPETGPSKMFSCTEPNCNKSYTYHRYLVRHVGVAHRHRPANGPPKPFTCEHCGKDYHYKYNLKYHLESQHLRTNYICEICGKGFEGSSRLKKHYSRHLGLKPFQCPNRDLGCAKSYANRSSLNVHLKKCLLFLKKR